jgi:signal transduction histidine kinase
LQRPAPSIVEIVVQDEGIGIPAAEQGRIFEPYYRASNAKEVSGTGLGMKLIRYVVERHSGSIRFDSREGEGTTFTLRLPTAS